MGAYKMNYKDITVAASTLGEWTDPVTVKDKGVIGIENTNLVATVTLQFKSNTTGSWYDMDSIAVLSTTTGRYDFLGYGDEYRVGVDIGDYTSGGGRLTIQG